jgi:hypothetical protein
MKNSRLFPMLALVAAATFAALGAPLGSSFTYQGRLTDGANAANGQYDLAFKLFDAVSGGNQAGVTVTNFNVVVSNGVFTTALDFGAGVFNGNAYWMDVMVRPSAGGGFTQLNPRQPITAAPYALTALSLRDGAVTASKIAAGQAVLSVNGLRDGVTIAGAGGVTVTPSGNTLTISGGGWALQGNAGTSPAQNFLGTTDNQPLELRVNNARALRVEPNAVTANLIGGAPDNQAAGGAYGAVVGGGGQTGEGNVAGGIFSFIGGGRANVVQTDGNESAIVGGYQNMIYTNAWAGFIGGGNANFIDSYSHFAVIAGGANNYISTNGQHSVIVGGQNNFIGEESANALMGGGADNSVGTNAPASVLVGGRLNRIGADVSASFIGGGIYNTNNGLVSVIGGGFSNMVANAAYAGTIAGGEVNYIGVVDDGTIGGGYLNYLAGGAHYATVAGGEENSIFYSTHGTISGGYWNYVSDYADYATVSGGADNWVKTNAAYATIPGGAQAAAISYGQQAYASGMDSDYGDAQASLYVLRRITTNAVAGELFLDGASERMQVPQGGSWTFQITIVARNVSGSTASFKAEGGIKNVGGTVSLIGTPTVTPIVSDAGFTPTSPAIAADSTAKALVIRITGLATQRIKWVARVQTVELKF